MKKVFGIIAIVFVIAVSCNDGDFNNGCTTYKWGSLNADTKSALISNGLDSTKCYKIEP